MLSLSALALLLVSCGGPDRVVEYAMEPTAVHFPAEVAASEPFPVEVELLVGGCFGFSRFEAERGANSLHLKVFGLKREGRTVVCNTGIAHLREVYTDPDTPARTDPFEVFVNGKSWGKVSIR